MLNKSLIQFSADGWSCVPSLLFTWGQIMVEVMKIMVSSLKRSHVCTATDCAPNPAAGHHQSTPSPETSGYHWFLEKWKWKLLSHVWLFETNGCTVHGILQARILEWVAFPFSRGSTQLRDWTQFSHTAGEFFTSWATREAQQYWSG